MNVTFLYIAAVLIWGTTWIGISYQFVDVANEVSLAYRFALAALMLVGYCHFKKLNMRFSTAQHLRMLGIALTMFSTNYYLLYVGQAMLNSALAAIAFSTLLVMNIINTRIFFGTAISTKAWVGAALGLVGICTLFWPEIADFDMGSEALTGLGICLLGTFVASLSNTLSISNQKLGMPVIQTNAWGMTYGAILMASLAFIKGEAFVVDLPTSYWISMLYLSLFGTVIAFGCYLSLLGKIGSYKASYIMILTPAVAVIVSSIFEDFVWTGYTVAGLALIFAGNITVLGKFHFNFNLFRRPTRALSSST